jgi:hypothetical protein
MLPLVPGHVLGISLFITTDSNGTREQVSVAPESRRGPPPSDARQFACLPHAGPYKPQGPRPYPVSLAPNSLLFVTFRKCVFLCYFPAGL